jgi:hypothetical protein
VGAGRRIGAWLPSDEDRVRALVRCREAIDRWRWQSPKHLVPGISLDTDLLDGPGDRIMRGPDRGAGRLDRLSSLKRDHHRKRGGKEHRLHDRDPAFSHRITSAPRPESDVAI